MTFLGSLFRRRLSHKKGDGSPKTSGELIAEVTDGANLVDGKQTWEYANEGKHDIHYMKQCCDAELDTMRKANVVAAPYYFE